MSDLGQFKGQPWVVYDTVAAKSFLVGESRPDFFAFGTSGPAITNAGELIFFSSGRTEPNQPWYTNLELVGQLSYGFEAWQVYVHFGFPQVPSQQESFPVEGDELELSYPAMLASMIINFGVLQLTLGQEEQMSFPLHRFGAGGGYSAHALGLDVVQNAIPQGANIMAFPEPTMIPRTQNIDAKIRLAPEILETIGTLAARGFGTPLDPPALGGGWELTCPIEGSPVVVELPFPAYTVQVGLIGRRIKKTQYGQVPGETGG